MAGFLDAGGGGGGGSPPEADGPDDPERGSTPPGDDRQEVEGEPGPDPDLADDETQDPDPATLERTLDQLRGGGGAAVDRDSVRLDSSDIPVAPGEWPLGFPIQGLPRAAVTFNLNFVYDDERDQWVRDTGNDRTGAVGAQAFQGASIFQSIPPGSVTTVNLTDTEFVAGVDVDLANNTITVQTGGQYIVTGTATFANPEGGEGYDVFILVNGGFLARGKEFPPTTPLPQNDTQPTTSTVLQLDAGDQVELAVNHSASQSQTLFGNRILTSISLGLLGR